MRKSKQAEDLISELSQIVRDEMVWLDTELRGANYRSSDQKRKDFQKMRKVLARTNEFYER